MNTDDIVVDLIILNGGELVGRTRLQKQVYLLDRRGADFKLRFNYHRYGPYGFELANGADDAVAEGRIKFEERLGRHDVPYAIFRSMEGAHKPKSFGCLDAQETGDLLEETRKVSDVVLELAATIVFLKDEWNYYGKDKTSSVEETKKRKPLKAAGGRITEALELLERLGWKTDFTST